jgi:hypothetical protein
MENPLQRVTTKICRYLPWIFRSMADDGPLTTKNRTVGGGSLCAHHRCGLLADWAIISVASLVSLAAMVVRASIVGGFCRRPNTIFGVSGVEVAFVPLMGGPCRRKRRTHTDSSRVREDAFQPQIWAENASQLTTRSLCVEPLG